VAQERLFVIGDAAGYVEPFTGEGIAWVLASGVAVSPLALEGARHWVTALAIRWTRLYHRLIGWRQQRCLLISALLRRTALTRALVAVLSRMPSLAEPLVRSINAPFALNDNLAKAGRLVSQWA